MTSDLPKCRRCSDTGFEPGGGRPCMMCAPVSIDQPIRVMSFQAWDELRSTVGQFFRDHGSAGVSVEVQFRGPHPVCTYCKNTHNPAIGCPEYVRQELGLSEEVLIDAALRVADPGPPGTMPAEVILPEVDPRNEIPPENLSFVGFEKALEEKSKVLVQVVKRCPNCDQPLDETAGEHLRCWSCVEDDVEGDHEQP